MILTDIVDTLIRSVSGGDYTDGSKWEPQYIEALVPQLRAKGIVILYNGGILPYSRTQIRGTKRLHPAWYQKFNVDIVTADQDFTLDYVVFNVPSPIKISQQMDGSIYVGQKKNSDNFFKAWSRGQISDLKKRGYIGRYAVYLSIGDTVEIYGNKSFNTIYVERILDDPSKAPNFDFAADYPVSQELLDVMEDIFKARMGIAIKLPKDTVNDQVPTIEKATIKANVV